MTVIVYPDSGSLAKVTAARLCLELADAGAQRAQVHLAIAGGSVGTHVLGAVAASDLVREVPWRNVHVWWVDERFVPAGDPDRNDTATIGLFTQLGIPGENIHSMPAPPAGKSDQAAAEGASAGARAYAAELARYADEAGRLPLFDVVLLGMGPDGHVASLFPDHPALEVDQEVPETVVVAVTDSPKPPAQRITLTPAALNHARMVWIAAWGEEKAPAIAAAISGADPVQIPAAGVAGRERTLWLTDLAGAGESAAATGA